MVAFVFLFLTLILNLILVVFLEIHNLKLTEDHSTNTGLLNVFGIKKFGLHCIEHWQPSLFENIAYNDSLVFFWIKVYSHKQNLFMNLFENIGRKWIYGTGFYGGYIMFWYFLYPTLVHFPLPIPKKSHSLRFLLTKKIATQDLKSMKKIGYMEKVVYLSSLLA